MTRLKRHLRNFPSFVPVAAFRSPAPPEPGVLAGLVALISAFWNLHIVVLMILVVMIGGLDLLVGARRAHLQERAGLGAFTREKLDDGLVGKIVFLVSSFFLGMAVDTVATMVGTLGDLGFVTPFREFTPITAGMLFYRLLREIASVMRNIDQTPGGKEAVWPALTRIVDTLRYRMTTPGAVALPERRWADDLTEEDRAFLARALADKRKLDG